MGISSDWAWLSVWTRRDCYSVAFESWWFHLQNRDAVAGGFEGRKIVGVGGVLCVWLEGSSGAGEWGCEPGLIRMGVRQRRMRVSTQKILNRYT